MIYDELKNLGYYANGNEKLAAIQRFLQENPLQTLADGRHELSHGVYCVAGEFDVRDSGAFEAHRNYADMQLGISGSEVLEWAALEDMQNAAAYDAEKDIQLFDCAPEKMLALPISEGWFVIVYPQDAHKPLMRLHDDRSRKAIFKIPV